MKHKIHFIIIEVMWNYCQQSEHESTANEFVRVYPEMFWHPSSTVLQIDVVYWVFEYSQQIYGDNEQSSQLETSIELSSVNPGIFGHP